MNNKSFSDRFALVIGLLLIVEGVWELFRPVVFVVLTGNVLHGVIHIALGLFALYLGWKARARRFCIFLGLLLLVVGALWFVPGPKELIVQLLNVNHAVAVLNLLVGAISLFLGLTKK